MNKGKILNDIRNYRYEAPNLDLLKNTYQNDYIKFRHPFYNSDSKEPENWYVIEMTKKIIEFAERWRDAIKENQCPSDFQIWLFQPNFNDSQIVAARIDAQNEKRDNFFIKPEIENEFPNEYFGLVGNDDIIWQHRYDTRSVYDFENATEEEIRKLVNDGYIRKKEFFNSSKREVEFYQKVIGNVWVGRYK